MTSCNKPKRRGEEMAQFLAELIIQQLNLPKNVEKGGWEDCELHYLIASGIEEIYEIYDALYQFFANPCEQSKQYVLRECGDAGAFLAMVADNVRKMEVSRNNAYD